MAARVMVTCGNKFFQSYSRYLKNQQLHLLNIQLNSLFSVTSSYKRSFNENVSRNNLKNSDLQSDIQDDDKTAITNNYEERDWLSEFVKLNKVLSVEEWEELKANAVSRSHPKYGLFRPSNFESQIMLACSKERNFSLAHSLFSYCQKTRKGVHLVTLSKYIRLCGELESEVDEESLLNLCFLLTTKFPVLDGNTAEDLIIGLCRTSKWKDSLEYLKMMKLSLNAPTSTALSSIAVSAFNAGEYSLGWEMATEIKLFTDSECKIPVEAWVSICKKAEPSQRKQLGLRLLEFLKAHEITLERNIAEDLLYIFESIPDEQWQGNITKVSFSGVCNSCNLKLESMDLSDAEFNKLRSGFFDHVIKGKDIYLKTNPQEVERFLNFIKYTAPFSVVLDGLNVSYMGKSKNVQSTVLAKKLLQVVTHFASSDRKVLVLGRNHMKKWPKYIFDRIKKQSTVFFTENLSSDDPFLLYAALYSGKGTMFISKDMMRDHLFVLKNANLDHLFRKWQKAHQLELLTILPNGEVYSKPPLVYNPCPQTFENKWHIPFYSDDLEKNNISWLCLENRKSTSLKVRRFKIDVRRTLKKF